MKKVFLVADNKLRLDRFLAQNIKELSRSKIQKNIEEGFVSVNSKSVLEGKFVVRKGDKIEYDFPAVKKTAEEKVALKTVFENNDILIIDKPAGLVVHPAPGYKGPTVVSGLRQKYKEINIVGEDAERPGIVHRLDKDTSGVMLIAKNQAAFEHLKDVFAQRKIKKEYIALVCGNVPNKRGFINNPIGRHQKDFRKMTVLRPKEAKEALTEYNVLEHIDGYTLVRVKLHTGRTHQIRVHFSSLGYPIAGDTLYGSCKVPNLGRQFLHAQKIEVQMPDKTWIEAEAELPGDLKNILRQLNSKAKI